MNQFDKDLRVIMKLAPFLIGAISAQSGDDADRWDNTDFSLTDNIFTYAGPDKDERFDKTECTTSLVIQAVTCWESNHMGNLDHYVTTNDDGFGWKNIHHGHDQGGHSGQAGTGNGQGTQESKIYGQRVPSTSPSYQIGTYSRGMMTDGVNGAVNKIDYHSAMAFDNRYSGCIYEAAGWNYDATTYNAIWRMSYGYDPTRVLDSHATDVNAMLNDASGVDRSNNVPIRPNWWHYFNSHILNVGQFDNQFDSYERHLLVMANPAYEGLGYLNWITTFAKYNNNDQSDNGQKADHGAWGGTLDLTTMNSATGFVLSNENTSGDAGGAATVMNGDPAGGTLYDKGRFRGMINHNTHDTVTDLFSGGYAFHLAMGCDRHVNAADLTMTGYTNAVGQKQNYDHQMNPEINAPDRSTEDSMFEAGDEYYKYYKVTSASSQGPETANIAQDSGQAEVTQWYSFLINPGQAAMGDPSLASITDNGKVFYPWMSMAAVSSFPHNDLGQDFRFNIRILHHGGRGFPYYFNGNKSTTADNVMVTANEGPVSDGNVAVGDNFSITNAQINYLAQDSYYWYKVNTVMIKFPSYVRCPRYPRNIVIDKSDPATVGSAGDLGNSLSREERLDDTFRCMDSANFNGHRGWDSSIPYGHTDNSDIDVYTTSAWNGWNTASNHRPDENHPLYLEQLTENDGSKYRGILVDHDKDEDNSDTAVYDSADGFICGDVPPFGSLTASDYKGGWYKCGQKYTVHGLMNTYDEHAQLEYGTMQEIWFQFWYHYVITSDTQHAGSSNTDFWSKRNSNTNRYASPSGAANPDSKWTTGNTVFHDGAHDDVYFHMGNYKNGYAGDGDTIRYDHVHNFPNILFNAFELRGIRFYCDDTNSFNSNTCFHTGQAPKSTYSAATLIGDSMTNP